MKKATPHPSKGGARNVHVGGGREEAGSCGRRQEEEVDNALYPLSLLPGPRREEEEGMRDEGGERREGRGERREERGERREARGERRGGEGGIREKKFLLTRQDHQT